MLAHQSGDAFATGAFTDDITGVADVRAKAGLVGFEVIGAEDQAISFGNIGCGMYVDPGFASVGFGDVWRIGAGFASSKDRFDDLPDGRPVARLEFADGNQDQDEGGLTRRKYAEDERRKRKKTITINSNA